MTILFKTHIRSPPMEKDNVCILENRCIKVENSLPEGDICESIRMATGPAQAKVIGKCTYI